MQWSEVYDLLKGQLPKQVTAEPRARAQGQGLESGHRVRGQRAAPGRRASPPAAIRLQVIPSPSPSPSPSPNPNPTPNPNQVRPLLETTPPEIDQGSPDEQEAAAEPAEVANLDPDPDPTLTLTP